MESKGSLVLYDRAKANKYSSSSIDSSSKGPFTLKVTDDGNLLIFDGTGAGYWSARPTLAPTGVPTSSPTAVPIATVAPTAAPSVSAACATPPTSGARAGGFSCVPPNCLQGPSYAAGANIYDLATAWKLCGITPGCGVVQAQSTSAGSRFTLRKGDETFNANAASTTSYSYPCAAELPSVCSISNPPESQRTYSTVYNNDATGTGHARSMLNSDQAWTAREQAVGQWATISLPNVSSVGGVITQGRKPSHLQYVSSFKVQASTDCVAFSDVDGGKVFTGNWDNDGPAQTIFSTPVQAKCIRVLPQTWSQYMSMRFGLLLGSCPPPLFLMNNVPESQRTYTSVWDNNAIDYARSGLESASTWCALNNRLGEYAQVNNLTSSTFVSGVVTQGRNNVAQWVTSFKVQASSDCSSFTDVDGGKVFTANWDWSSYVETVFASPVQAKCIRILPQTWNGHMCMRFALLSRVGA